MWYIFLEITRTRFTLHVRICCFRPTKKYFMENPLHEQKAEVASCESRREGVACAAGRLSHRLMLLLSGCSVTGSLQQGAAALYSHAAQRESGETFVIQAGVVKRGRIYTKLPGLHVRNKIGLSEVPQTLNLSQHFFLFNANLT